MMHQRRRYHSVIPLPSPICGADRPGSWANTTIDKRLPDIARLCMAENNFNEKINQKLQELIDEISQGSIRSLRDNVSTDINYWKTIINPYIGMKWMDVPWIFAEFYFYRRVLEATGYFVPSDSYGKDPFEQQKVMGLVEEELSTVNLCEFLRHVDARSDFSGDQFQHLLYIALWGNQLDLSIWHAGSRKNQNYQDLIFDTKQLVIDESIQLLNYLVNAHYGARQIDIIADNAGFELVCDLALIYYLLSKNSSLVVHLHVKPTPVFVSDAMIIDFDNILEYLTNNNHRTISRLGVQLSQLCQSERIILFDDPYWALPLAFWELPDDFYKKISSSDLVIIKGDANYRRLLGDRNWEYSTPISDILSYIEVPVTALRVYKSELAAGINGEKLVELRSLDPQWMTDGKWGMIQFVNNRH